MKQSEEEIIVVVLDEVNLNIYWANMIQSEKDADLLEQIETGLAQALLENENQPRLSSPQHSYSSNILNIELGK